MESGGVWHLDQHQRSRAGKGAHGPDISGGRIISPPDQSVIMYLALQRAGVPAELHIYGKTAHDFGVRNSDRPYSKWTASCADWLRDNGFLNRRGTKE